MDAISLGLIGMRQAEAKLESAAARISRATLPPAPPAGRPPEPADSVDLSAEMVALLEARHLFQANARVVRTGGEMLRHLLDLIDKA